MDAVCFDPRLHRVPRLPATSHSPPGVVYVAHVLHEVVQADARFQRRLDFVTVRFAPSPLALLAGLESWLPLFGGKHAPVRDAEEQHLQANHDVLDLHCLAPNLDAGKPRVIVRARIFDGQTNSDGQTLPKGQEHDSLYRQEFGERRAPRQVAANGMVEFQQAGKREKDGNVRYHCDDEAWACEVIDGFLLEPVGIRQQRYGGCGIAIIDFFRTIEA
mmetsp:Transcript_12635/g.36780  ORF Transcript_12635/g.36780 Transcript_12635/m.36780 type:complete len:217 (-) Transcript_12635:663-1313(-)